MPDFDVAASVDVATMNAASATVYTKVYPGFFKGSATIGGASVTWDVTAAPTFDLTPVSDLHDQIGNQLRLDTAQNGGTMSLAEAHGDLSALLQPSSFTLQFPSVSLSDGGTQVQAALSFACTITTENAVLKLQALSGQFTTNAPAWDKLVIDGVVNEMMAIANSYLGGVSIPIISFQGITLTAPTISVQGGRVVVFFNLGGKAQPGITTQPWPGNSFFLLLSDEAKTAIGQAETGNLTKTMSKSGEAGTDLGGASYHADATVSGITVASSGAGSPEYAFQANVSGGVGANVKVLYVPIGVSYDLYAKPNPSGTIQILAEGDTLVARTQSVSPFVILISPSGSFLEKVISAITTPILMAISAVFSPIISQFLAGISFEITTLPTISINIDGVSINLQPANMQTGSFAGYMMAYGSLQTS